MGGTVHSCILKYKYVQYMIICKSTHPVPAEKIETCEIPRHELLVVIFFWYIKNPVPLHIKNILSIIKHQRTGVLNMNTGLISILYMLRSRDVI